jgi:aminoglycoside/choline kinase family phosphotransferase
MTESANRSQSLDAQLLASTFANIVGKTSEDLEIIQLAGDASTRRYFRIIKKNSLRNDSRVSWILQCAETFDLNSSKKHSFLTGQSILRSVGVRVPRVIAVNGECGWILMEDLGDETLQNHLQESRYRQAIDFIITWTLHAHPKNPNLPNDVKKLPQFSWSFDLEKLEFEMGFTEEHLFKRLLGMDGSHFRKCATPNSFYLSQQPRFYCHRDYHCRNLMFFDQQLAVIDFQDARLGPITYDIVSLLWDPYVRLSEESRSKHLMYWKSTLVQRAKSTSWIDITKLFEDSIDATHWTVEVERMKVQRLLKAAGSYASFYNVKGRRDYLPSTFAALDDTLRAIDRILTMPKAFVMDTDHLLREEVKKLQKAFSKKMREFG